ncbi:Suppressor of glycerol defect protein 1 [Madurella mycetomatis]|uniref:Suppressor of glycerol defect protein 1 n=1 Tax=Madurella mycetomatis TaxID=100816 RepID=A0A175W5I7_9PEZI|nr:Suppressor of glycerol defect protein 1 [Madurella mycetomatis]
MPPPGIKKPALPLHLLKELGAPDSKPGQRHGRGRGDVVSRKERRKAERKQSRAKRATAVRSHHTERSAPSRNNNVTQKFRKEPGGNGLEAKREPKSILKRRKPEQEGDENESDELEDDEYMLSEGILDEESENEGDEEGDGHEDESDGDEDDVMDAPPKPKMSKTVKDKLAQDDAEIADLERKLGLKNRKNLPQSFKYDGLGDLLDSLGGSFEEEKQEKRKRKAEADEWLAQKRRKAEAALVARKKQGPASDDSDEDAGDFDDLDEDIDGMDEDDTEDQGSERDGLDDDDSEESYDEFGGFNSEDEKAAEERPEKRVRENPYVAPSTGQTAKYVPPSLRRESGSDAELAARIRRQTQGLVNRITESNILTIMGDIEKLYRECPRQHVTFSLVDLLLIQVCDPTSLPDTLLILTAGFATAAYKVIGTDFGGQLIQEVVERFDKYYEEARVAALERPDVPKQTSNLITFVSELYNFQLIGPNLVFDYIRMLLETLSELNAELLLRIVRMCGPTLRQDDPMALKDIVSLIPPAVAKAGEKNLTVRTKFMIDTITDLKNNKLKAGAGASAIISEHTTRMKKLLGQLKSRKLNSTEPMRMGLKDIQDADKKGKWWLVGASWAGRSVSENGTAKAAPEKDDSDDESLILDDVEDSPDLGELAREQGMNTEVRRSIFISIMSAMDYQDAYFRILKLRLNKERQREIPNVIIRCVGAEQHYNPYYTLIAKKLCSEQREVKWAFQYSLWKLFGRMGETGFGDEDVEDEEEDEAVDMRRLVNTAKMFGALVAGGSLGLVVLKRLNLLYLQKKTRDFVEVMLITALLECQASDRPDEAIAKAFSAVDPAPDLARGLQYFLKKVVRKSDLAGGKKNAKLVQDGCKLAEAAVKDALSKADDLA